MWQKPFSLKKRWHFCRWSRIDSNSALNSDVDYEDKITYTNIILLLPMKPFLQTLQNAGTTDRRRSLFWVKFHEIHSKSVFVTENIFFWEKIDEAESSAIVKLLYIFGCWLWTHDYIHKLSFIFVHEPLSSNADTMRSIAIEISFLRENIFPPEKIALLSMEQNRQPS